MSKANKAAMLSAFLFPGFGHFFLKCYLRGLVFSGLSAMGLYTIMAFVFSTALSVAEQIQRGEIAPDPVALMGVVHNLVAGMNDSSLMTAKAIMLTCWVISTADAYRVGRKLDKNNISTDQHSA